MAITWRGSAVTPMIQAMPPLNGSVVVLAIVNTFRSRAKIDVLRIVNQFDTAEPPTGTTAGRIAPIMRTRRCAAADVSGGVEIKARAPFDTAINAPDPGVKLLFDPGAFGGPDTEITAANRGGPFWEQFTTRDASAVEQRVSWDNLCVPALTAEMLLVIAPGEALIIEQQAALPTGGAGWFGIAWEEDQIDVGYVIGGSVQLEGFPVNGAKVLLVTDSVTAMTNPELEVITTGAPGTFAKTMASGVKAAVFVQHENGGNKYSDEGKPFIEK